MSISSHHGKLDCLSLDLELKRLKLVVSDIKNQNAELVNILSNISMTMKEMSSKYDVEMKAKDYEIDILKEKLQQSENSHFEEENESSGTNGFEDTIEIENTEELIESQVIFDVLENQEIYHSTRSSPVIPDDRVSSKKFQFPNNNNSKATTTLEKNPVERQNSNSLHIDEWTVVSKKCKEPRPSNIQRSKEITYSTGLEVSHGWTYLHLYNVKLGTTEKTVLKYVRTLIGYADCTVVALKARGEYASFKIGVPADLAYKILKTENWTGNIRIKPWTLNVPPKKIVKSNSSDDSKANEKDKALLSTRKPIDLQSKTSVIKKTNPVSDRVPRF